MKMKLRSESWSSRRMVKVCIQLDLLKGFFTRDSKLQLNSSRLSTDSFTYYFAASQMQILFCFITVWSIS